MSATHLEAGTQPGVDYLKALFSDLPTDTRFTLTRYQKFSPKTSNNAPQIEFEIEAREAPECYLFGDILLEVKCVILDEKGQLPARSALVTLVNNSMHSLFSSMHFRINSNETT